jgi:steroid 5-alpha reductase family enzyme
MRMATHLRVFVFFLLMFVSGVPLLEKKADKKWGGQPDYENYKATTSVFLILPKLGKRVKQESSGEASSNLDVML